MGTGDRIGNAPVGRASRRCSGAATDANSQGETFAGRLRAIADEVGCDWLRLKPPAEDWNDALKAREEEKKEKKARAGRGGLPHARQPRQG